MFRDLGVVLLVLLFDFFSYISTLFFIRRSPFCFLYTLGIYIFLVVSLFFAFGDVLFSLICPREILTNNCSVYTIDSSRYSRENICVLAITIHKQYS